MKRYIYLTLFFFLSLNGMGQSADPVIRGLEKSASEGNISAQIYLGDCYLKGILGCSKNLVKARMYYQLAAKQGDAEAQFKLANLIASLGADTDEERKLFFENLVSSADKGYVPAQHNLGVTLLSFGEPAAFGYLNLAANSGDTEATFYLGKCYMKGIGCSVDYKTAIACFSKAKDCVEECDFIKVMQQCYFQLDDFEQLMRYIDRGVELGEPESCCRLAVMKTYGKGVKKDVREALRLIDIAISKDNYNPKYKDRKGEILLKLDRTDEAKEIWIDLTTNHKEFANSPDALFCHYMQKKIKGGVDMDIFVSDCKNDNTYVVIIANENYRREETVPFALNDGKIFKLYCQNTLGIPEKNINYLSDATYNDIRYGLNWLERIAKASSGTAKIIFYYAGHGVPNDDQSTSYLLPTDGFASDFQTGFDLKDVYELLDKVDAKQILVLLDACFSGAKRNGEMLVRSRGVAIKTKQNTPLRNMVVLSAAQGGETAYQFNSQRHGMFTYFLLKKLQETKGDTTLGDLFNYICTQVSKQSVLENGKSQTPTVVSGMIDEWRNLKLK